MNTTREEGVESGAKQRLILFVPRKWGGWEWGHSEKRFVRFHCGPFEHVTYRKHQRKNQGCGEAGS